MELIITHNAGFFSCCSVRLHEIINYFNNNKLLPTIVNSSGQFKLYKINKLDDITFEYFEDYNNTNTNILYTKTIDYKHRYQYNDYSKLDYKNICPFIRKYFNPSIEINNLISNIENKYEINYENICVLFYRGNDKNKETVITDYDEYIKKANELIVKNPNLKFLIQSDESEFIEKMFNAFPNSFYFKDEIRHMNKCNSSVDYTMRNNICLFSKNYLAITIIMSKCKYIICGSGNCSIWILLYRENAEDVYQNQNGKWLK